MSGTFPTSPGAHPIELISHQSVIESISESGKRQSRVSGGHLWRLKLGWPKMTRPEFAPIFGFSARQRGDSFQITLPNFDAPQGVVTGSVNVNGTTEVGSTTINIENFIAGTSNVFKAGDILKAANHSKVYMVTDDADAGANSDLLLETGFFLLLETGTDNLLLELSGQASVSITPPTIEEITDGIDIIYTNVPFTVAFEGDIQSWKTTAPQMTAFSANLIESIT